MYVAARSWGIAPQDFYGMTLPQLVVEAEHRAPRDPDRHLAGTLTQARIDALAEIDFDAPGPAPPLPR